MLLYNIFLCVMFFSFLLFLTRNPFTWVFSLLALFIVFSVSIFFFSEFIGLLILLVYTGGIAILFIFTCIPLNIYSFYSNSMSFNIPFLFLIVLKVLLYKDLFLIKPVYFLANDFSLYSNDMSVYALAESLYLNYPILLCVVSFFLLLCMVGALAILRATL